MAAILGPLQAAAAAFDLLAHALGYLVLVPSTACVLWWAHSRLRVWRRERGERWNAFVNAELYENAGTLSSAPRASSALAAALSDRSGVEVVDLDRPSDFGVEELYSARRRADSTAGEVVSAASSRARIGEFLQAR